MNRFGPRVRTQDDYVRDALMFIVNARPVILLAETAEHLCDRCGIRVLAKRREVEAKLLAAQAKERRRMADAASGEGLVG